MDLIRMLLKMNPRKRHNTEQTLNRKRISSRALKATGSSLQAVFVDHLRSFGGQNKLKKTALKTVANRLNDTQIQSLRVAPPPAPNTNAHACVDEVVGRRFVALAGHDGNGNGLITAQEVKEWAGHQSMTADKTFITYTHASIEKKLVVKTQPSTTSLLQVLISSKESRRSAPTALSGARAAGVGHGACLGPSEMVPRGKKKQRDATKAPSMLGVRNCDKTFPIPR